MTDYFKLLEITQDIEGEELKSIITERRKLWLHRCNSPDLIKRHDAELMLEIIEEAESILLDPEKRAEYIAQLNGSTNAAESDLQNYLDRIKVLLDDKKWNEAASLCEIASRMYPNSDLIFEQYGYAYYCMQKYDEAVNYFTKAIDISPSDGFYYYSIGDCRFNQSRYDEAAKMLRSALMLNYNNWKVSFKLAVSLKYMSYTVITLPGFLPMKGKAYKRGSDEEAYQILTELYQQDPSNTDIKMELLNAYKDKLCKLVEQYTGRIAYFPLGAFL